MSTSYYNLIVKNQSGKNGYAMIFCEAPDVNSPDVETHVWQSKFLYTGVEARFKWQIRWDFMWKQINSDNGAQQIVSADLEVNNQITLGYDARHEAFHFFDQTKGAFPGSFYIKGAASIPSNTVLAGMALSGYPAFMVNAKPNMDITLTPKPSYWLVFDDNEQHGPVTASRFSKVVRLEFPPNIFSLTATVNQGGSISIKNTPLPM